ncbi:anaerobic ribonucleoside-triphosphate reductase activating protein [Pseudobacteroides cellulosolvens]|uniref:Anaerobic ribonucleoside-triphosphate reductase-activating protein n=1 Tax=Pseudobacteroides cellulosolvens ATCC 35603 = DSM 2933 TaxID=398512 RepID=A0A0L6JVS8_9FIRM|nr:anaerobic ribonucleoside-triphosphate reductase activating protein [Pseudobacteroides cellulosolvens]KNY29976.1 anaerobic ribonucleoside-triphosphate reductase activating protein [Pseudobacteroides cellulosolvens ATCC 35603 = DSM 2933]
MSKFIRIAGVVKESIVDGPGLRYVVFAQGCKHNCKGCHNPHTHSFEGGSIVEVDSIISEMKANPLLDGITLSGGEPFEQAECFGQLAKKAKANGYDVMTYTGYSYEDILKCKNERVGWDELFENSDVIVDGKYEENKRNLMLSYRGSENQRIIDVGQSIALNKIVQIDI